MTISTVTSEALQLKLRQLLPSQQGFGSDLSASDTIIPIIDLTASAEGSDVRQDLQTALSFGSQTAIEAANSTVVAANSPRFYRLLLNCTLRNYNLGAAVIQISMTDGSSTKIVWAMEVPATGDAFVINEDVDLVLYIQAGESFSVVSNRPDAIAKGSVRQIASNNGELVQPVGFTPQ